MTTCDTNDGFSTEMKYPAAKQPCIECPFRKKNEDITSGPRWYDRGNFTRIWRNSTTGSEFGCHMFDNPEATGYDETMQALGYKKPANLDGRKECAGSVALLWREIEAAATYPDHAQYIQSRPHGLRKSAWLTIRQRLAGNGLPLTPPADPQSQELVDPGERIDKESVWWKYPEEQVARILAGFKSAASNLGLDLRRTECDCPVCVNHAEAHEMTELILTDGTTALVDLALHPLLAALSAANIRTTASCENMGQAIRELNPRVLPEVLNPPPGTVNYAEAVTAGKAFIRFKTKQENELKFLSWIKKSTDHVLAVARDDAQVSFHLNQQDELLEHVLTLGSTTTKPATPAE